MKSMKLPIIIVVSNGKGGVGKTTYCMHLISSFLKENFKVFSIDLDCRQKSLTTYINNRKKYIKNHPKENILLSEHVILIESKESDINKIQLEEQNWLEQTIIEAKKTFDIIIIDTPGDFSYRSAFAHTFADIVITPINDSFVDISLVADIDENLKINGPSIYSNIIWEQKMQRAKNKTNFFEWYVVRNRVNTIQIANKRKMDLLIQDLSKKIGFKIGNGFADRVIFKDLFLHGLTLTDIGRVSYIKSFTPANLIAKTELRLFLQSINFQDLINLKK
ncbi:MAG: division plane positioning ATPase MipZ [Rickettsiales bacterium]